jgi:hypothetical protein
MEKIIVTIDTTKLTAAAFFQGSNSGKKYLQVEVTPRKGGADDYGKTHTVAVWDKQAQQRIYVGDGKAVQIGQGTAPAQTQDDDLPVF